MCAALDTPTKKKLQDGERQAQVFDSSEQKNNGAYEAEFLMNGGEDKTYRIHRGKTSQSRHLTSTPQDVKPMVPHRVYKQPTSVREEAPTKSLHPCYQDKHSSTTQTHSQNKETTISRS